MEGNHVSEVRISDTLALTRSLEEFRHLDQQERALAERMAAQAAMHEILEQKQDVEELERTVSDRSDEGGKNPSHNHHKQEKKEEQKPPPPETSEGHLLDLKA